MTQKNTVTLLKIIGEALLTLVDDSSSKTWEQLLEVKINGIKLSKQLGTTGANHYCQRFCYTCTRVRFLMLWVVKLIYPCGGKMENLCGVLAV